MTIRDEPFIWIHLAGVALFPLTLAIALVALGIGNSYYYPLELGAIAVTSVLPILWMQLSRPFDIFSILFLSLKPESLTEQQRQILAGFKTSKHKLWSAIAALAMLLVLWLIYSLAPLTTETIDFLPQWRILGLLVAAVAFLASNLFLQVPLSVLLILSTEESKLSQFKSDSTAEIPSNYTVPGIKVERILGLTNLSPQDEITG